MSWSQDTVQTTALTFVKATHKVTNIHVLLLCELHERVHHLEQWQDGQHTEQNIRVFELDEHNLQTNTTARSELRQNTNTKPYLSHKSETKSELNKIKENKI